MIEKVEIGNPDFECYECPRCSQHQCGHCNEPVEVDFNVIDSSENHPKDKIDWKDESVCPFCYNQLVDIKSNEKKR